MAYQFITYEEKQQVACLTLNRPEKLNSFNRGMISEIQAVLKEAGENPAIRALIITGSGRAFCAGQDLKEPLPPGKGVAQVVREQYNPMVLGIRNMPKPVLCALNGISAGAGTNFALCCDIVIAAESASLTQGFNKIGLIPDCGGTFLLPRLVGMGRAAALMMLSDKISAKEAQQMGLIYEVVEDESLMEAAWNLAFQLAQQATLGLAYTKALLNQAFSNDLETQLEQEAHIQQFCGESQDFQEGIRAFAEMRLPKFSGQ